MIKIKKGNIKGEGKNTELLQDLTFIVSTLITDAGISEKLIDIAVGLGKAHAKGKADEYMANRKNELQEKLKDNVNTVAVNLSELMKQVQQEKEENED